jgi:hypothetical protein
VEEGNAAQDFFQLAALCYFVLFILAKNVEDLAADAVTRCIAYTSWKLLPLSRAHQAGIVTYN